jgi:preprotein translocase subunit YajC
MNLTNFLLQAAPQPGGNSYTMLIFMVLMLVIFYFFLIRPQKKKADQAKQFQQGMGKGEKIVTIAGIHGTINKVNEDGTLQLEISPGSYMKIEKTAISMEWTNQYYKAAATPAK